jgi:SnoaL-like protein
MTEDEAARIEAACIRLQQRYGTLADRQDPKFRDLFTPDASITLPEYPPFAGVDKIMAGQAEWKQSGVVMRHVCTNFTIEVADADNATGLCYLMVFNHPPMAEPPASPPQSLPVSIGEFHDTFVRVDGKWLIKSRVLRRIFRGAAAA